jgi:diaminopimelate epimerase
MLIHFYKYHGAGNDFIIIDNRKKLLDKLSKDQIKKLCHRRFGIGADGLMLLKANPGYHFEMDYYNSDGSGGSMCGNGGRCITAFARHLGIIDIDAHFLASDGPHEASFDNKNLVKLKMVNVNYLEENDEYSFLNTGSPHYVRFVPDVNSVEVFNEGRKVRYSEKFRQEGTNVNFVSKIENGIAVRTYERGVEDETYACGTGSVASAIAYFSKFHLNQNTIDIKTLGGFLQVSFEKVGNNYENVYLKGPAILVFEGDVEIE